MPGIEKKLMLQEIKKRLEANNHIFLAKFKGLSVSELMELRKSLRKVASRCFMAKLSMIRLALEEKGLKEVKDWREDSLLLVTTSSEPQIVSKTLCAFAGEKDNFEIKGAFLEGELFDTFYIKQLSRLPSRKELLTIVTCDLKSPLSAFVLTLGGLIRSLTVVLDQIGKKR